MTGLKKLTPIRAVRIFLLFLICVGLFLLCTQSLWLSPLTNWILRFNESIPGVAQTATTTAMHVTPVAPLVKTECTGLCAPFDYKEFFNNETGFGSVTEYSDSATKAKIDFSVLTGLEYRARNATANVYVGGVLAGQAGGEGIAQVSFSPDHKYFGFRTRSAMGGSDEETTVYIVDLSEPKVMYLLVHPTVNPIDSKQFDVFDTFVESYVWGKNDTVVLTVYSVALAQHKDYRISSKQLWSFDLSNPESVMRNGVYLGSLPE